MVRRALSSLCVALLLAAAIITLATIVTAPIRVVPVVRPFGVTVREEWNNPAAMKAAQEAGVRWVRGSLSWAQMEPVSGIYRWDFADLYIMTLTAYGFEPVIFIAHNPTWAAATDCGPVTDTQTLAVFMGALADRYQGEVTYWALYNEPDYRHIEGNAQGCWGDYPAAYADLLTASHKAMHEVNPAARLVFGVADEFVYGLFNTTFAADVMDEGGLFDVMDVHYYPAFAERWDAYGPGLTGKIRYYRQLLAEHGRDVPIMVTETGMRSDTMGDEAQSIYVAQTYTRAMSEGVLAVLWFSLADIWMGE